MLIYIINSTSFVYLRKETMLNSIILKIKKKIVPIEEQTTSL